MPQRPDRLLLIALADRRRAVEALREVLVEAARLAVNDRHLHPPLARLVEDPADTASDDAPRAPDRLW